MMPIADITEENANVKTFWFDFELPSKPGQFVMVWVPGVDQKPFSIAYNTGKRFGLSIFAVGPLSNKLFEMKVGDRVGITGPYGVPYKIECKTHYITVGGGYGSGPLGYMVETMDCNDCTVDFCIGARNKDLLLFADRVKDLEHVTTHIATDDGSAGHKGYVTEVVEELLQKYKESGEVKKIHIAACGPELMEKAVLDLANKYDVDCEISVERFMKCGFGVCGQCCVDDSGVPVCKKGPVMDRDTANNIQEFGKYHRDKSGAKHNY